GSVRSSARFPGVQRSYDDPPIFRTNAWWLVGRRSGTLVAMSEEATVEELASHYRTMRTIREFENRVHKHFALGEIPGFVHLYAGEEAIAAGVCAELRGDDYIGSTHRGHGHAIAKGCDVELMMAEVFGRSTGLCKGKGGSMHIADLDRGMLGAN